VVAWALILAAGAFLLVGGVADLITDARSQLPSDHSVTFTAVTGTSWQHGVSVAHSATPYMTRTEAGYGAYEVLFAVLFLIIAAIPLRCGERWAWWSCWLIVLAFATFGAIFGAHDRGTWSRRIRPSGRFMSMLPERRSPIFGGGSRRGGRPSGSLSMISHRACNWRRCRTWRTTGQRNTTGADARRG
jgi:hypothetical protein